MPLHPDRLLPPEPGARAIARRLYENVRALPIISPHGHTDPNWYADNAPFPDPATLFVKPDHYIFRMLYSQGVKLEALGLPRLDGAPVETDNRKIWRIFADNYHLFRGTPSRLWFEHSLQEVFGIEDRLNAANADLLYDRIAERLGEADMRPRALYERFNIEVISTTDAATDALAAHDRIKASGWTGRVVPAYRPDAVIDASRKDFRSEVERFLALAGAPATYAGYLDAHRSRRAHFRQRGATSTDHGHPSARTADLSRGEAAALFERVLKPGVSDEDADLFRAQMLTEMARMSIEDGMVMQIHPGSFRNHNPQLFAGFGPRQGGGYPDPHRLCERPQAAARRSRQRHPADADPVHAG